MRKYERTYVWGRQESLVCEEIKNPSSNMCTACDFNKTSLPYTLSGEAEDIKVHQSGFPIPIPSTPSFVVITHLVILTLDCPILPSITP